MPLYPIHTDQKYRKICDYARYLVIPRDSSEQ